MPPRRSARLRRGLVEELERRGLIASAGVRDAFLSVPRELFVPEVARRDGLEAVYRDAAIVTRHDVYGSPTSSSSQPAIMALMLERLGLAPGQRVLEIGAGTGYNAALLATIVGPEGRVVSVELDPETARAARQRLRDGGYRVRVASGDGREGWAAGAPYDRIIATASTEEVPRAWLDQLADDGLVEFPLRLNGPTGAQAIATFRKERARLRSVAVVCGGFMPLRARPDDPTPRLPSVSATYSHDERPLVQLEGDALGELSRAARRRLLATALSEPRLTPFAESVRGDALFLYLSLEAPRSALVTSWGKDAATGVIARDGRSVALVVGWQRVDGVTAYGGPEAEERLARLIERWRRLGSPTEDDLSIEVRFRGRQSSIDWSWRRQSHEQR